MTILILIKDRCDNVGEEPKYSKASALRRALHWPGAYALSRTVCQKLPGVPAHESLPTGEVTRPPLAWVGPRDLPKTACFAPFLLPSSKMNHSFGDISPTDQFNELKQALLDQNTSQGCQVFFPSDLRRSKTAPGFLKRTARTSPSQHHTGLR